MTTPRPILVAPVGARRVSQYWAVAAGIALFSGLALLRAGYGNLNSSLAIAPRVVGGVCALLLGACAWASVCAFARWKEAAAIPYRRARFVFPASVIDTSDEVFRVFPLTDCSAVEISSGRALLLTFTDGARFLFDAENAEAASAAREAILSAKRTLLERELIGTERAQLDPLVEPRYSNPLSSRVGLAPPAAQFPHAIKWVAVVCGLALGISLFSLRNVLSERRMFAKAVAENSSQAYLAYQQRGGKREQVAALLLPRAELAELANRANLTELEAYAASHESSPIRSEIEQLLKQRLIEELLATTPQKTLAALGAFEGAHAGSVALIAPELKAARRALLTEAFERFAPRAAETEGLVPFMKAVMDHVAEHGPLFEVRFQRTTTDSVVRADAMVREDKYFNPAYVPSQYFEEAMLEPWLARVFEHVFKGLGLSFPTDVLDVKRGASLPNDKELPSSLPTPSLVISLSTNMGRGIKNRNPSGTFFGVGFQFKTRLLLAGREPLELRYALWKPPDLLKLREGKVSVREVYQNMSEDAFKGFDRKLGNWLFKR